jgi:hypothetical protein
MEFRAQIHRAQGELSLARGTPLVSEQLWLRVPAVMLFFAITGVIASFFLPSPEIAEGGAIIRLPGIRHVRVGQGGAVDRILVEEGSLVEVGQVLATLESSDMALELGAGRLALADVTAAMLREPADEAVKRQVSTTRLRVRELEHRRSSLVIRAPETGRVLAKRLSQGAAVKSGDIAFVLGQDRGRPEVSATFVGPLATRVRKGARIRLFFDGFGSEPIYFSVMSVAEEAVRPDDPYDRQELAVEGAGSSVVVVHGMLDGDLGTLELFDGMTARAEVVIRPRSMAERLAESLGWRRPR